MSQQSQAKNTLLARRIIEFGKHVAGSRPIKAAYVFGDYALGVADRDVAVEVLLIIEGYPPKLMNYVTFCEGKSVVVIAVDLWVFERDVERGFLGEALAWGLLFPYLTLKNEGFLRSREVKLKKRLVVELLGSLVLAFPELSHELHLKPEYFMYQAILARARLFPPLMPMALGFMLRKETSAVLDGYREALKELEAEGQIALGEGYVKMTTEFVEDNRNPGTRLTALSRSVPRALFSPLLGVWSRLSAIAAQSRGWWRVARKATMPDETLASKIVDPEKYVYVPTASGLIPLNDRVDVKSGVRELVGVARDEDVRVERFGGILNDVYLAHVTADGEEKRVIVKKFRDWSNIKWFPLALWGIGTKNFAVLGLQRLERECSINKLLHEKGFEVPRLLRVSPAERLVFMEHVEGENLREVIGRAVRSRNAAKARKELKALHRVGKKLAKIHALGVSLGDTKPENILIGGNGEVVFMDFEQASRGGDMVWDVAEFLYYAGHDMPALIDTDAVERITGVFVSGYLDAGGDPEVIRKVAKSKYTKVFSVFTLPHVMLAVSRVCRNAEG